MREVSKFYFVGVKAHHFIVNLWDNVYDAGTMKPIFLIGYMGCGKTTLGQALAKVADVRFVDLDDWIEESQHATVREIFADRGEDGFRQLERDALREVASLDNAVIACGGGTPCFFDNMEFMNAVGLTVWLDVSMERLMPRLIIGKMKRPLLARKTDDELERFVTDALNARREFYAKSQSVFNSDFLENQQEVDSTVRKFMDRYSLPVKCDCGL